MSKPGLKLNSKPKRPDKTQRQPVVTLASSLLRDISRPCATSADALYKFSPSLDFDQRGDADADITCEPLTFYVNTWQAWFILTPNVGCTLYGSRQPTRPRCLPKFLCSQWQNSGDDLSLWLRLRRASRKWNPQYTRLALLAL